MSSGEKREVTIIEEVHRSYTILIIVRTSPESLSTPMCALMPKCHWLPFSSGAFAHRVRFVFGRARRSYQGSAHQRALGHQQPALYQYDLAFNEHGFGQVAM